MKRHMKNYLLVIIFFTGVCTSYAQSRSLLVEMGYAVPLDGFSRSLSEGGAFAGEGLSFGLSYQKDVLDRFSVSASYFLSRNPVERDEIDNLIPVVSGLSLNTGHWLSHSALLGAQFLAVNSRSIEVFAGPLAGFTLARSPSFEGALGALSLRIDPETGGGFVYGGEIGGTYWSGSRTGLRISIRYITTRPEPFSLQSPALSIGGITIPSQEIRIDTRLSLLSTQAGFVYRF
jgi:hypothetical protein